MPQTPNHEYEQPDKGDQDWDQPLNDNFGDLDTDVEIRDTESNASQYTPKAGAKFFATDTGNIFIGDGSSWNELAPSGESPTLQTRQVNEVGSKVLAASQSIPEDTTTKLEFNTVDYDELGDFVSADDQFELSKSGIYHALVEVSWDLPGGTSTDFLETEINPNEKARVLKYDPGGAFPDTHLGAHFRLTGDPPSFNELFVEVRHTNGDGSAADVIGGHLSVVHLG